MRELIEFIARRLAGRPDEIEVREEPDGHLLLLLSPEDVGRVVGRRGRTARALRTVLRACSDLELEITDRAKAGSED